jgi:hypothetical protein
MARVKFGSIVTAIAGKVGGNVFQENPKGWFMKTLRSPRLSRTASSLTARNNLARIGSLWQGLSSTDRASWALYNSTFFFYDRWGNRYTATPYQKFVFVNSFLIYNGFNTQTVNFGWSTLTNLTYTIGTADISTEILSLTYTPAFSGFDFISIYVSELYRQGQQPVNKQRTFLKTVAWPTASPNNLYAAVKAKFGAKISASMAFDIEVFYGLQIPAGRSGSWVATVNFVP